MWRTQRVSQALLKDGHVIFSEPSSCPFLGGEGWRLGFGESEWEVRPAESVSWLALWAASPLSVVRELALKSVLCIIGTK